GKSATVGNRALDGGDDDTVFGWKSGQQELRLQRTDLLFGKIDHADNLPTEQILGRIKRNDLRTGLALAIRAEIDPDPIGRLACLGKFLDAGDRAGDHEHTLEFTPTERLVVHQLSATRCRRAAVEANLQPAKIDADPRRLGVGP